MSKDTLKIRFEELRKNIDPNFNAVEALIQLFDKESKMNFNTKEHFIVCACRDLEHMMRFQYFADDEDIERIIYFETHLRTWRNIFRRYWEAVKYLWGYKSRYGEFDEVLMDKEEVKKLVDYLQEYLDTFEAK